MIKEWGYCWHILLFLENRRLLIVLLIVFRKSILIRIVSRVCLSILMGFLVFRIFWWCYRLICTTLKLFKKWHWISSETYPKIWMALVPNSRSNFSKKYIPALRRNSLDSIQKSTKLKQLTHIKKISQKKHYKYIWNIWKVKLLNSTVS